MVQKIEAQDIATSGWNFKSSSSSITLSFWVRASTNQTFYGFLKTYDGTQHIYAFSFTASGNNTWTKITKTIIGDSNLQFDNNNAQGLQILLTPFYGTDYTNNRTLNTWTTVSTSNYFPDMASTWLTAGASTWDVTGFQLTSSLGTISTTGTANVSVSSLGILNLSLGTVELSVSEVIDAPSFLATLSVGTLTFTGDANITLTNEVAHYGTDVYGNANAVFSEASYTEELITSIGTVTIQGAANITVSGFALTLSNNLNAVTTSCKGVICLSKQNARCQNQQR